MREKSNGGVCEKEKVFCKRAKDKHRVKLKRKTTKLMLLNNC